VAVLKIPNILWGCRMADIENERIAKKHAQAKRRTCHGQLTGARQSLTRIGSSANREY